MTYSDDSDDWNRKVDEAVAGFCRAAQEFVNAFGDLSDWWAILEGQWPDRFTVLNRYLRTGQRPPYVFND